MEQYVSFDGSKLSYVSHSGSGPKAETAIVYLHGIESHAGWFYHAADLLAGKGYDVYCLDRAKKG